jgi:hypothetical protein
MDSLIEFHAISGKESLHARSRAIGIAPAMKSALTEGNRCACHGPKIALKENRQYH